MNYVPSKDTFKSKKVSVTAHLWKTVFGDDQVKSRLLGWACTNTSGTLTNEEVETANRERQLQAEGHSEWLAAQEVGRAMEDTCPRVSEESPTCSPTHRHTHTVVLVVWSQEPHCMLLLLPSNPVCGLCWQPHMRYNGPYS